MLFRDRTQELCVNRTCLLFLCLESCWLADMFIVSLLWNVLKNDDFCFFVWNVLKNMFIVSCILWNVLKNMFIVSTVWKRCYMNMFIVSLFGMCWRTVFSVSLILECVEEHVYCQLCTTMWLKNGIVNCFFVWNVLKRTCLLFLCLESMSWRTCLLFLSFGKCWRTCSLLSLFGMCWQNMFAPCFECLIILRVERTCFLFHQNVSRIVLIEHGSVSRVKRMW